MAVDDWFTDDEYERWRAFVAAESGIRLRDDRRAFVARRLAGRLAAAGTALDERALAAYRRRLEQRQDPEELLALLDSLTVNETSFFRHQVQWDLVVRRILPERLGGQAGRPRLRLWSAGCSTGAEAYTLAIVVAEALAAAGLEPSACDVRIRASDLSLTALAVAEAAEYPPHRLENVSPARLARYFVRQDGVYRVRDDLRRWVEVDFHNLLHPAPRPDGAGFDAVFCRNVLIYFGEAEQRVVVGHLVRALRPGGYLLVGHAESLLGLGMNLEFVHEAGGTAYRLNGA